MILGKIKIQNFKSIIDSGDIQLSQTDFITILAGQNESGKTAFLRALKFFEEGAYTEFEEEDRRMETSPRVECTFYLTKEELKGLKGYTNKKIADCYFEHGVTFVRDYEKSDLTYIRPIELVEAVTEYNHSLRNINVENEGMIEFSDYAYSIQLRPNFVFYSSFTNSILPGKIMYGDIHSNQAVQDFQSIYDVNFEELLSNEISDAKREIEQERIRKEASASLNQYWKQTISGEEVKYKFIISIKNNTDISQSYVNFFVNQGDLPQLRISQKSQGFQWFSSFNLRLRAHQTEIAEKGIILLIDEPGQGLHEQAQNDVKDVIQELANESRIQIIYSTHQPILLGKVDIQFSRLLFADRNNTDGSKFKTITQLINSTHSSDALSPIKSALGLVSIASIPVDKKTLIVEGMTEYFYLKGIFGDTFTIIPSTGVSQIPNLFSILYGWGIEAKALVDNDNPGEDIFNKIRFHFFNDKNSEEFKKSVFKHDGNGIESLLSKEAIISTLSSLQKNFDSKKNNVVNIKQVGKLIFAKSFHDHFSKQENKLDNKTMTAFQKIKDFIDT